MNTPEIPSDKTQLELFKGWFATQANQSQTVELFDAMPKYVFDRHAKGTSAIQTIRRTFTHKSIEYGLRITPAIIERNGKDIGVFPGVREEMVVRTILHMAVQQLAKLKLGRDKDGNFLISASFTLSQLRKHLSAAGRKYSVVQIDEAIRVCRLSSLDLQSEAGGKKGLISSGIFMTYSALDENTSDKEGEGSHRYVVFNPLVTRSILEKSFRAINYERLMSLESPLARWLYERLSHNFRQAEKTGSIKKFGYNISLSTILLESGFTAEKRVRDSIDAVRKALIQLRDQGVLERFTPYEESLTYGVKSKGPAPVVGAVWVLYPSASVVDEIIEGNQSAKQLS